MSLEQTDRAPEPALQEAAGRSRSAVVNAGWNAFATVWGIAAGFVLAPVMIHSLGTSQYGTLLLVWSFTGVLGVVSSGFGEATLRYVAFYNSAGDMEGVNRVFGSNLSFYIVACSAVCIPLLAGAHWIVLLLNIDEGQRATVALLLRLAGVVFSLQVISGAFASVAMALHRYDIASKMVMGQSFLRTAGYIALALSGFGAVQMLVWDVAVGSGALCLNMAIARRVLPDARLIPSWSLRGLKEIAGYSIFSYLTFVFHSLYRESGKYILGALFGPAAVTFLATPDSIAHRIYMVIVSGIETLMPRFSATKDELAARRLVLDSTWTSLAATIPLLVPLVVLMPDFLRLWISPEFARESSAVGQLVALALIPGSAYTPIATLLRGSGRPGHVTAVMAGVGCATLVISLILVPSNGLVGVGYAYLLSSVIWLIGLLFAWSRTIKAPLAPLARSVGVPLLLGAVALGGETIIRVGIGGHLNWIAFVGLGTAFTALTGALLVGVDRLFGGRSPSTQLLEHLMHSTRLSSFLARGQAARVS